MTFLKIATQNRGAAKTVYHEREAKRSSVDSALFRKECKRFTSSATYMLNSGLGTLFLVAAAVASLIFRARLRETAAMLGVPQGFLGIVVAAAVALLS